MEILQTYETTLTSADGRYSLTVLVIPARSYGSLENTEFALKEVSGYLFGTKMITPFPAVHPEMMMGVLTAPNIPPDRNLQLFASYVTFARIIPFEQSPLGAESLASIAVSSLKAGTIGLGATVGYVAAGPTPFLLITVPLGIVLCGASVSFAKWLEENRKFIWNKLLKTHEPQGSFQTSPSPVPTAQGPEKSGKPPNKTGKKH